MLPHLCGCPRAVPSAWHFLVPLFFQNSFFCVLSSTHSLRPNQNDSWSLYSKLIRPSSHSASTEFLPQVTFPTICYSWELVHSLQHPFGPMETEYAQCLTHAMTTQSTGLFILLWHWGSSPDWQGDTERTWSGGTSLSWFSTYDHFQTNEKVVLSM
jgi:hypothetical protein